MSKIMTSGLSGLGINVIKLILWAQRCGQIFLLKDSWKSWPQHASGPTSLCMHINIIFTEHKNDSYTILTGVSKIEVVLAW